MVSCPYVILLHMPDEKAPMVGAFSCLMAFRTHVGCAFVFSTMSETSSTYRGVHFLFVFALMS